MICEPWDVVVVPFPFSERRETKRRPALTLSRKRFNERGHTILAMITTATQSPWPGDVTIHRPKQAGLHVPCLIRLKLFTLDNRLVLRKLGRLTAKDGQRAAASVARHLVG